MKNLGFLNSLLYYTVQSSLRLQGNDHEFAITFFSYLKPGYLAQQETIVIPVPAKALHCLKG